MSDQGKTQPKARSVDELVATYAHAGRTQENARRKAKTSRTVATLISVGLIGAAGYGALQLDLVSSSALTARLAAQSAVGTQQLSAIDAELERAATLQTELAAELKQIRQQRAELTEQRGLLAEQQKELVAQLDSMNTRRQTLSEQQEAMAQQGQQLAATIAAMEADRDSLIAKRREVESEGPAVEAELVAINERRQNLDDERKRFRAQRELLQHELTLLNDQRAGLEAQQEELQSQWLSLQEMLDKVAEGNRQSQAEDAASEAAAQRDTDATADANIAMEDIVFPAPDMLMASSTQRIDAQELGEIRGGFNISGDLDIAIGLTRSVSINGVTQYSSTLNVGDLSTGQLAQIAAAQPLVIQNGPGNTFADPGLGASGGSFSTFIQNTLDNQIIVNTNQFDVSVGNVAGNAAMRSVENAISETLIFQN